MVAGSGSARAREPFRGDSKHPASGRGLTFEGLTTEPSLDRCFPQVVTTAYKWLRAVPPTTFTGPHMDRAYVGEGRRLTAWIPLGPVRRGKDVLHETRLAQNPASTFRRCGQSELGSLCWIPGSHTNPAVIERFGAQHGPLIAEIAPLFFPIEEPRGLSG